MSVPYLNRKLFSDHWLRERLPQRDDYALTPLALAKLALWLRGAPLLTAPELATLRAAHRDTRDILASSRSEREATVSVIDLLL